MEKKSRLGRGLDALWSDGGASAGTQTQVPVEAIERNPYQPRKTFDSDELASLCASIRTHGVLQPLVVRQVGERYQLVAGERRLRAAREAGLSAVPVIVRELDDHAALEMSLVENLVRDDLNAVEEARAFRRLSQEFRLSHEEIALRIGKSRPYVTNTMRLLELVPAVLDMIERGELSAGQARPLLGLPAASQTNAARRIVDSQISARGAEEIAGTVRRARNGSRGYRATDPDPNLTALAEAMQRALKRKVRIVRARGRTPGRIELEYYDIQDLSTLAVALARSGQAATSAAS